MAGSVFPRILLDTGDYRCGNLGDVAMLQVAVSRLEELWPNALVRVLTEDPRALAKHCPSAEPVACAGRDAWFSDKNLLGRVHALLPGMLSRQLVRGKDFIRSRWPTGLEALLRVRAKLGGTSSEETASFLNALSTTDLVGLSGAGGMMDGARAWSLGFLSLFEAALRRGTPTVMFGHGFGRVEDRELVAKAREILPRVDLICLREGRNGPRLLESFGVPSSKWLLTGDDAIEPAYEARATSVGSEVGVNLRIGARAGVDRSAFVGIGPVLQQFARTRGVPLVGIPITVSPSKSADSNTIREFLERDSGTDESLSAVDTPREVMERVSRCRIVVTGAYHAAVFALAQGIPAVCLAKTEYFVDKFEGLAAQFGVGLVILDPSASDFPARLAFEMQKTWEAAPSWRAELLESAVRQIAASREASRRIKEMVVERQAIA